MLPPRETQEFRCSTSLCDLPKESSSDCVKGSRAHATSSFALYVLFIYKSCLSTRMVVLTFETEQHVSPIRITMADCRGRWNVYRLLFGYCTLTCKHFFALLALASAQCWQNLVLPSRTGRGRQKMCCAVLLVTKYTFFFFFFQLCYQLFTVRTCQF